MAEGAWDKSRGTFTLAGSSDDGNRMPANNAAVRTLKNKQAGIVGE